MGFEHWEVEMALEALLQDPLLTVRRQSVFYNVTYAC